MRRIPLAAAIALLLTACPTKHSAVATGAELLFPRGGVVRVAAPADDFGQAGPGDPYMDPSREYAAEPWEIFRCCLLRTLYNYSGKPTNEGGAELRPDLATGPPSISADGTTWTFHIKAGIHYAPPLATQEIVAGDFITALKRTARVTLQDGGDYSQYFYIIQGYEKYANKQADTISGLATPDAHTLVVTLTERTGDLADRFVLAATAPIPTLPSAPDAPFGVATGHDAGYGRFLVASGPYMFDGSAALDLSASVAQQKPVSGFPPKSTSMRLVRNPSWVASSDALRPAYPDEIDVSLAPSLEDLLARIDRGDSDVELWDGPPLDFPKAELAKYQNDPTLGRLMVTSRDSIRYASLNLAIPPFDDVHVRKAVNLIVDKQSFVGRWGGPLTGAPATHVIMDSLEDNQLVNYDPYRTSGPEDALEKARAEMRLSRYDANHDGICDAAACTHVRSMAFGPPSAIDASRALANELSALGIHLDLKSVKGPTFFQTVTDPTTKIAVGLPAGWSKDFINASNYMVPLFASPHLSPFFAVPGGPPGTFNYALVGATSELLRKWGYGDVHVPSADDRIKECLGLTGAPQLQCWSALDQYLMETVVPWIPLLVENGFEIVPKRVVNISIDQFITVPSLDQVVVRRTPSPSPS